MRKIIILTTVCSLLLSVFLSAQSITGKVLDPNGEPVSFANVVLYAVKDSSMTKVEFTDENGAFELPNIPADTYWINITYVGLPPYNSDIIEYSGDQDLNIPAIRMSEQANDLEEVVVTAQRPLLEVKPDKMVFNVDGSINASGSNALELLRKSPGVVVDNNDNITMLGKSGVQVYIDGKPSPLGVADLAAFLKTVQSNEIDAIEIITNPSSKYDAEGNGGIINIKMKKDKRLGANANVNLGYSTGKVGRYNGSVSGNYRDKNYNVFGNYGHYSGENRSFNNFYREQNGFYFDQKNKENSEWGGHNFRTGVDFFLNDKNTIGILANGNIGDGSHFGNSRTRIGMLPSETVDSVLIAQSDNQNDRTNLNLNLNYSFDNGKGKTLTIDADYGQYRKDAEAFQPNYYYNANESEILSQRINRNETPTDIDIYTFKTDYERPFLKGQLGAGLKFSFVNTDNTFNFYTLFDEEYILDIDRSNHFEYKENVNAAYLNYSRQIDKFGIQVGLRTEHTHSTGDLTSRKATDNDFVERDYVDFFPSGGITYAPNDKHSLRLSYSRRINRPSYQDLNPFENKLDELTFEKGNPFLRPEYTNTVQLTHSFNYKLTTTLSFSHTKDLITRQTDTGGVKSTFITWLNLDDQYTYSLGMSAPIPITEWWNSYTNLTGYYTHNQGTFEEGKEIDLSIYSFNVYSQQTFRLPNDFAIEVSGWYNSPSIWGGNFKMESQWAMDLGVQKKLFDGRGNVKVSVSDVFKTNVWFGTTRFGGLFMDVAGGWDSRRLNVNFSYLIGNSQVKSARKRKTGLEEEKSRVKG